MPNFELPLIFFIFAKFYVCLQWNPISFLYKDFAVIMQLLFILMQIAFRSKIFLRGSFFTRVPIKMALLNHWSFASIVELLCIQLSFSLKECCAISGCFSCFIHSRPSSIRYLFYWSLAHAPSSSSVPCFTSCIKSPFC